MNIMRKAVTPQTPETSCAEVDLRRVLEQGGWRYTRQRAAVYDYLRACLHHPTAEQVFASVRQHIPNISLATVYKALEALVAVSLARRVACEGGAARYDGRSESHYHLRCQRTGQVRDLPLPYDPQLLDKVAPEIADVLRQQGFEVTGHRLEIVGYFRDA
jgi:Fe2+ or Zn2+ uptake regulation protein